jgi:pimeloyl-ACP methyl ester carboxylesterase
MATKKARNHVEDLRGASRLAVEATRSVTDLVETMHRTIAGGPDILGRPLEGPVRVLTAPVYGSIRAATKLVAAALDVALAQLDPLLGEGTPGPERELVLAVLNGVLGDYLSETNNPLAIEMRWHRPVLDVGSKMLVLVHGSSMHPLQWNRRGHDHGAALARDLGYTPIYLHYNSGLHISTNGRGFCAMLEELAREWPVPLDEIAIVAHSMGGLVSRSACHFGEGRLWRTKLRALTCLGSPHHGAPLERGGNWIDVLLGINRYSAPLARLGRIRSAGITDMRFGNVLDEHWEGLDRFERGEDLRTPLRLPKGVRCHAIAGTTAHGSCDKLPGDGLVPVDSALGRHIRPELTLHLPEAQQWIAFGTAHLDLLNDAKVYAKIRSWLSHTGAARPGVP